MSYIDKIKAIRATKLSWLDNEYLDMLESIATYNGESLTEYQIVTAQSKLNDWYAKI